MANFAPLESPKLISRKIWVTENLWNFNSFFKDILEDSWKPYRDCKLTFWTDGNEAVEVRRFTYLPLELSRKVLRLLAVDSITAKNGGRSIETPIKATTFSCRLTRLHFKVWSTNCLFSRMEDSSFKHYQRILNATSFITLWNTSFDTFLIRKVSGKQGPTYLNNHWLTFVSSFYDPTEPSFAHRIRVPEQFFINQQFTSAKRMTVSYLSCNFNNSRII